MSNNLDLEKEGVVETSTPWSTSTSTSTPDELEDVDDQEEEEEENEPIKSNITPDGTNTKHTNHPTDDSDDDDDDDDSSDDSSSDDSDDDNNNIAPQVVQINDKCDLYIMISLLILIISIIIGFLLSPPPPPPPPPSPHVPFCSKIPDASQFNLKLECPPCDKYDINGKCIIYIPYNSGEYALNPKGKNEEINQFECTTFEWIMQSNEEHIFIKTNEPDLAHLFDVELLSPGREYVDLIIEISIRDHLTNNVIYHTSKECNIELIIYESPYFGIDLGTTYSCISYQKPFINHITHKRDTNIVIMDKNKQYCIPTAIYFNKHNNYINIGNNAKYNNNDDGNLISDIKRIIGRTSDDPQLIAFNDTHKFNLNLTDKYPTINIANYNKNILPEQALAPILIKLVQTASNEFGVPYLRDVVVSIPAIFHDAQRKAVHTACQIAGLNAKLLVVEPSAASIAHIYYANKSVDEYNKYFMTLDIGGGTTDVSILRCNGLHCEVLGIAGNSSLGGIDFDNVIINIFKEKISKKDNINVNDISSWKLNIIKSSAEDIKILLSTQNKCIKHFKHPNDTSVDIQKIIITKHEFEQHPQTQKLINNIINLAKKAMYDDNPLSTKVGNEHLTNIKAILLIGGTVKIPLIQDKLSVQFKSTKLIYPSEDPQLMVVAGSGIIGGSMAYTDKGNINILHNIQLSDKIYIDDVLPMSIGIDVCVIDYNEVDGHKCGIMDILINKNSRYPTSGSGIYCQKLASMTDASLMIYEGDNKEVNKNFFLTKLDIFDVPIRNEYECNNILVQLNIDNNGIMHIEAKTTNNKTFSTNLPIQSNDGSLTDDEIQILSEEVRKWFPEDNRPPKR